MQFDEIKCTLLHKISYFICARVVKHAQNLLFISAVCTIYFSVSSKNLAFHIIFRKIRHFFVNSVHKTFGYTGTCQIFADIYKNIPQTGEVFHIYQVVHAFNYLKRGTLSPSLLPFR